MKNLFNIFLFLCLILFFPANSYAAKGIAQRIEEKVGLDEDATLQERVAVIGQKLADICERKDIIFTFKVLKGEDVKSKRVIRPSTIGQMEYKGYPYLGLEAFCEERQDTRVFRVEKILEMQKI